MQKQGLAKALFVDSYQRSPWLSKEEKKKSPFWPLVDLFLKQRRLNYLDYAMVHRLLQDNPDADQAIALFLCHIILAAKEGHLCVRIVHNEIIPSVQQLWRNEESEPLGSEEDLKLTARLISGALNIPENLVSHLNEIKETGIETITITPLCKNQNDWYLQKHWYFETLFLHHLKQHLHRSPFFSLDPLNISHSLNKLCNEKVLLKEQSEAIMKGCTHSLTLVTGGPGTGKTYTAGHLIKIFWDNLSSEQKTSCQIVLAAPTGKAAANLQKSLSQVAANLEGFPLIEAKTLHSLLKIKPHSHLEETTQLTADLILIDESSMIDLKMMAWLFKSLKPGSRLVLLGDQHQLPSVDAGSVFVDLNKAQHVFPHAGIPCAQLTVCLRAELKSLIDFAQLINQGKAEEVINSLNNSHQKGVKRLELSQEKKEAQHQFVNHASKHFPSIVKPHQTPEQLLQSFQTIRVLSPVKNGPFGVETINRLIWQQIIKHLPSTGWVAIPIMITTNDYRQELFNGETGVLIRKLPLQSLSLNDYAIFSSRQLETGPRRISALLLPKHEHAYCLSVHKSQGSEFDHVLLALPKGSETFGREVLYTAVTRAKKLIEIYGSDQVISKTIEQQGLRLSGILQRLHSL